VDTEAEAAVHPWWGLRLGFRLGAVLVLGIELGEDGDGLFGCA
jgi:hypothetical protein